jgi:hypothetical protein
MGRKPPSLHESLLIVRNPRQSPSGGSSASARGPTSTSGFLDLLPEGHRRDRQPFRHRSVALDPDPAQEAPGPRTDRALSGARCSGRGRGASRRAGGLLGLGGAAGVKDCPVRASRRAFRPRPGCLGAAARARGRSRWGVAGMVAVEDVFVGTLRSDSPAPALDRLQNVYSALPMVAALAEYEHAGPQIPQDRLRSPAVPISGLHGRRRAGRARAGGRPRPRRLSRRCCADCPES